MKPDSIPAWHQPTPTARPSCPHCYPEPDQHEKEKAESILDYYCSRPFQLLSQHLIPKQLGYFYRRYIKYLRIKLLYTFKALHRTTTLDRSQFRNYVLVFWDAALARGLTLYNFKMNDKHTFYFLLIYKNQPYYFQYNPVYILYESTPYFNDSRIYDYKDYFKQFLAKHHFPFAKGESFTSARKAQAYGMKLGFPLVVKPAHASLSRHVTVNITSASQLKTAIKLAKQINYSIIVEQFIPGENYRAIIFNQQVMACCRRLAPTIVGDGVNTVEELIEIKNTHPLRGAPFQRNATLHKIEKNPVLLQLLAQQQVSFSCVLEKNKIILLSDKVATGNGADIIDVTGDLHPSTHILLIEIAKKLNIPLVGLDFICTDIKRSWQEQRFAILENNSLPFIDMHHFPTEGPGIQVADKLWAGILEKLDSLRN